MIRAAFAIALAFGFLGSPAPAKPRTDWARTVVATGAGGFRMGNPAAKVKLLEYGSLACPHCRHFEETGSERAAKLLADWPAAAARFTTVMPRDYARVLAAKAAAERDGLDEDATTRAMMEAI